MNSVLLASSSPRRAFLIKALGISFGIYKCHVDETIKEGEAPLDYLIRVVKLKATQGLKFIDYSSEYNAVIAADTIIVLGKEIIGKPTDFNNYMTNMRKLSGHVHNVITGLCVAVPGKVPAIRTVVTKVDFIESSDVAFERYWQSGEPLDKAGGYAIQGLGSQFIKSISGSPGNVIGLPIPELNEMLSKELQ